MNILFYKAKYEYRPPILTFQVIATSNNRLKAIFAKKIIL